MRRTMLALTVMGILRAALAFGDSGDDTLAYYLSKSALVVMGSLQNPSGGARDEMGVISYAGEFRVDYVLKGDAALKGSTIRIALRRYELDEKDRHPLIKHEGDCILFLRKAEANQDAWETVDYWFGVQPASAAMARALKRLAKDKAGTPRTGSTW